MTFFNICPRNEEFLTSNSSAIPLRVIKGDGIDTSPDNNITVSELSKGYKNFYNNGSTGGSFKIHVLIKKEDAFNGKLVTKILDEYYRNSIPLMIYTDAIDIDSTNTYLITKNPSRKQTNKYDTVWELEFTVYTPLTVWKFKNDNAGVLAALKKTKSNKSTKKSATKNAKLSKCNYKSLVYSKKKKVVACVKYMQEILYKKKYLKKKSQIDGWFGKETTAAVKKFQKDYNKKHVKSKTTSGVVRDGAIVTSNKATKGSTVVKITGLNKILPENGKVDKTTFNALCWA